MFDFGIFTFPEEDFFIMLIGEMGDTSERCIIFEIAKDLKTFIFSSKVRCSLLHTLKTLSILLICLL